VYVYILAITPTHTCMQLWCTLVTQCITCDTHTHIYIYIHIYRHIYHHMCICMYVCIYMYGWRYMHTFLYVNDTCMYGWHYMHTFLHVNDTCMHAWLHTFMHGWHMHTCIHACMADIICTRVYTRMLQCMYGWHYVFAGWAQKECSKDRSRGLTHREFHSLFACMIHTVRVCVWVT
jgi:hypothetical protein